MAVVNLLAEKKEKMAVTVNFIFEKTAKHRTHMKKNADGVISIAVSKSVKYFLSISLEDRCPQIRYSVFVSRARTKQKKKERQTKNRNKDKTTREPFVLAVGHFHVFEDT